MLTAAPAGQRRVPVATAVRVRMLGDIARDYEAAGFPEPVDIAPAVVRVRGLPRGGAVEEVRWQSGYRTWLPELQGRYDRGPENDRVAARLYRHATPRPVVVLLHGYLGGQWEVERRVWPLRALHAAGLDTVLFALPFHGVRAIPGRRLPPFPSADPRLSNEGFRQAVTDLRTLIRWLRRRGHGPVGLMGMSLGGYTAALTATVEETVACLVPVIPLASLADFAREHGRLGEGEDAHAQHLALDAAHRCVSPLHRAPQVTPEQVMVVAGRADRITALGHARRLAEHFAAPLRMWPGGHLLQVGRGATFRDVLRFLTERLDG